VLSPRRLSRRERWIVRGVVSAAVALVLVVGVSIALGGHKSSAGCIDVTSPGFIGSQEISGCGSRARAICQSLGASRDGYSRGQDQAIAAACRKQGIRVRG
jgi:hypothetical protein